MATLMMSGPSVLHVALPPTPWVATHAHTVPRGPSIASINWSSLSPLRLLPSVPGLLLSAALLIHRTIEHCSSESSWDTSAIPNSHWLRTRQDSIRKTPPGQGFARRSPSYPTSLPWPYGPRSLTHGACLCDTAAPLRQREAMHPALVHPHLCHRALGRTAAYGPGGADVYTAAMRAVLTVVAILALSWAHFGVSETMVPSRGYRGHGHGSYTGIRRVPLHALWNVCVGSAVVGGRCD
ncbi:hypothetical protein C8Q76DRAFT_129723 [Earliella scabrosa]|nr:hypothetical protein C8Q76DRAFT_129723 [Earliella scabrosa]